MRRQEAEACIKNTHGSALGASRQVRGPDWFPGPQVEKAHAAGTLAKWKFIFTSAQRVAKRKSPPPAAPNVGDSHNRRLHLSGGRAGGGA